VSVYAFIFARGGSVGLPGKNIKLLGGVPLLGHSIRVAQKIPAVKKIFVSTDSDEIGSIANEYGVDVIKRPASLATSTATEWDAWKHAVEFLNQRDEYFEVFLSLPTTSPLRAVIDVEQCLIALKEDTDVVLAVTPAARSPYFNMVTRIEDGTSKLVLGDASIKRRQDAPELYDITTVAYVTRPGFIMLNNGLFTGNVSSVIVPKDRAVDIDDEIDFMLAESIYNRGEYEFET